MTEVVLVNVGEDGKYGQIDDGLGVASVGLQSITAHLKNNGVIAEIIDQATYSLTDQAVFERVLKIRPKIVGFNPLINTRKRIGELAKRIKQEVPEILIIIGGYDATFLSLTNPLYSSIDVIVRGKGEIPALELVEFVKGRKNIEEIQGVSYRREHKVIENFSDRARQLPVSKLPIPLRQNLEDLVKNQEPLSIYSSYGCNFKCKYCSTPAFYPEGRVERNLDDVLKEIDSLAHNGVKKYSFYDEDLFFVTKQSLERADKIIKKVKEKNGLITFSFITTPGILQAEKYGLLQSWKGPLNRLYVGIEGGCNNALKGLGKLSCMSTAKNSEAIKLVRKYNIGLQIGFIMFNPYSTFEELEESAKFLLNHDEAVNCISFFHHLRPYGGTEVYDQLKREGLLIEEEALGEIDLHSGLPYHFNFDIYSGDDKMKKFARAICPTSNEYAVTQSDILNNEIYMKGVSLGIGKEIFFEGGSQLVHRYRNLRKEISRLNYLFFIDSLRLFQFKNGQGFEDKKLDYLNKLANYISQLKSIKAELYQD